MRNEESGRWEEHKLQFGALGICGDDIEANEKLTPGKLQGLGSIRIKLFRAFAKEGKSIWDGKKPFIFDELPETIMKGKELKTNVK